MKRKLIGPPRFYLRWIEDNFNRIIRDRASSDAILVNLAEYAEGIVLWQSRPDTKSIKRGAQRRVHTRVALAARLELARRRERARRRQERQQS